MSFGGATKPSVTRVQGTSQATPLADRILKELIGQLNSGQAGTGFGPLQQESGTAIRQYVNSGGGQFDTSQQFKDMEAGHDRRLNEGAAQLREGFGMLGGRYGTGARDSESRFRADAEAEYGAKIGEINRQEFGNQQMRLLQAIGQMFNMGTETMRPFYEMAGQGIMPETIVVGDSPANSILGTLTGLTGLAGGLKDLFGGGVKWPNGPTMGPNTGVPTNNPLGGEESGFRPIKNPYQR